jgi:chemotaxis protein methyltransferase CheR
MPVGPDIVAAIAERLAEHAGLELPTWLVEARVASRVAALEITPANYVALVRSPRGTSELDRLIEAVRVGESRLFRHRGQIGALVNDVVPALRASGKRSLKIWSAGCSTGEEPYTLAAVLARALAGTSISISILATDVSADALEIARGGRYSASAQAHIPEGWRDAFVIGDDGVSVRPEVGALVTFERANLLEGSAPRGFDIVWCRNVLIYFTPAARQQVIDRLVGATVPGGYVFVGYSESLREIAELRPVRGGEAVYYVRAERAPARGPTRERAEGRVERRFEPASELTPPPTRIPLAPPPDDLLVLDGQPNARDVAAAVSARLAIVGLRRLVIDLDPAQLLDDEIAPILARARAAARAANVELVLKATRSGTRRWLARHALDRQEEQP